jgi:ribosomal protein S18 acetylase RimI-like enzyme
MEILEIKRYSKRVFKAVNHLLPQLDPGAGILKETDLKLIIKSPGTHLFAAITEEKEITGILLAVIYRIPSGTKFWIEDVVVAETNRGRGIGKELMLHAMDFARSRGASAVDLTSRPSRIAANRLYIELGFKLRETNVYRYSIRM